MAEPWFNRNFVALSGREIVGCYIKRIENLEDKFKREDMELAALITPMWIIFTANVFNV